MNNGNIESSKTSNAQLNHRQKQDLKNTQGSAATSNTNKTAVKRLIFITMIIGICLFGSAGTTAWLHGWIFMVSYVLVLMTLTGLVFSASPELVEERMSAASKAKSWDKVIVPILAMVLPLLSVVLAGLDRRFGWTQQSIGMVTLFIVIIVMIGGCALTVWAMHVNRFFSSHVRIQSDRGHYVISNGPYQWIRHPGYTGSIIYNIAVPVLLGSFPALGVGVAFALLMSIRTALEDSTLQAELPGYQEYVAKVRWRLIPYIW